MHDHIGIVACSAPGAALCYETICAEAPEFLGSHAHPEVSMHAFSFAEHVRLLEAENWEGIGQLLAQSATKLASIGASFAICPDNTAHQAMEYAQAASPVPWLHIAEPVLQGIRQLRARRVGILGTRYLMEGPVYREKLDAAGIEWRIPPRPDRDIINSIIFKELVLGRISDDARTELHRIIEDLRRDQSCQAIILGCTELPLAITSDGSPLPVLDSTRLLARAAIRKAIGLNTS
jgi:aspartate racemase